MRNTSTVPSYSFDKETGWRLDLPTSIVPGTRVLCLYRVSTTKQLYNGMTFEQFLWAVIKTEYLCYGGRKYISDSAYYKCFNRKGRGDFD